MPELKVLGLTGDKGGCAFYRMREPARVVNDQFEGVLVELDTSLPIEGWSNPDGSVVVNKINTDADVLIFQRPLIRAAVTAIKAAQKAGIACIVEIDDDLSAVHRDNVAHRWLQPENSNVENYKNLAEACAIADWVTVSTPALARRYGNHGRVSVVRNYVPEELLKREKPVELDEPRVGWSGTVQTHPWDLDVAGTHIGSAVGRWGTAFSVVGDGVGVREKLYIPERVPVTSTGWVPLEDYYDTLLANIDIGIVPLELSAFNQAKSGLKGIEYAACGIPFIASPTEEYTRLAHVGVGVLAEKRGDWQRQLKQLLTDADYFLEEAAAIRDKASAYTYETHAEEWVTAWLCAVQQRRYNRS